MPSGYLHYHQITFQGCTEQVKYFEKTVLFRFMKPVLIFILAFFSLTVVAQDTATTNDSISYHFPVGSYLGSCWANGTKLLISPLHWSGKNWAIAGATVATTTGLYFLDNEINKPFSRWKSGLGSAFGKTGNAIGPPLLIGSSLVVLGTGIITKSQPVTDFAADNLQAQLYTAAICLVAKELFGRAAPGQGVGSTIFDGPLPKKDGYTSFFSGHSSVAFATATSVYLHSGKKWWVGLISYGTASGIAFSRLQHQNHWASDIFFGAVTGTAVSSFVYHQNQKKRKTVVPKQLL